MATGLEQLAEHVEQYVLPALARGETVFAELERQRRGLR